MTSTSKKKEKEGPKTLREYLDEFMKTPNLIKWIWTDIIPEKSKKWSKWMIFVHIIGTIISTAGPFLIALIIDNLPREGNVGSLRIVIGAFLGFVLLQILQKVFECGGRVLREYQLGENIKAVDRFITRMFLEKSIGQHRRERRHLSVANIEKGRNRILNLQFIILFEAFDVLFRLVISFVALLILMPSAALIVVAFMVPYMVWSVYMNSKIHIIANPIDKRFRKLFRVRVDKWNHASRVKLACMVDNEIDQMDDVFDEIITDERKFWLWFIRQISLRDSLTVGAFITVVGYAIYCIFNQIHAEYLTVGMMYPLIMWTYRIIENIWMVGNIEHQFHYHTPSVHALKEVTDLASDVVNHEDAISVSDKSVKIEFRNVCFRHKEATLEKEEEKRKEHPLVLKNVSFIIEPGEKVGCVGPSGAGKSTVTMLLLRAFDPDKGSVLINGTDLRKIKIESWWRKIGYIPQKSAIFDGTLRQNLVYGLNGSVSDQQLQEVVDRLKIDFGDRLVDGLETIVGEDGIELSGGEQQRLMAGSAVLGKPSFMVIDEATSSLDSTTEKAFQAGLDILLSSDMSAFIIAHRLSTIRNCDKVIVLRAPDSISDEESQIEAIGRDFQELMEISPTFRQLAIDQDLRI
jgi:ABC-type multidrug transport system fused ATPase/permease subunit